MIWCGTRSEKPPKLESVCEAKTFSFRFGLIVEGIELLLDVAAVKRIKQHFAFNRWDHYQTQKWGKVAKYLFQRSCNMYCPCERALYLSYLGGGKKKNVIMEIKSYVILQ